MKLVTVTNHSFELPTKNLAFARFFFTLTPDMWTPLNTLPPDPIFDLDEKFQADPRDPKVYLALGLYFDEQAQPVVFDAIQILSLIHI